MFFRYWCFFAQSRRLGIPVLLLIGTTFLFPGCAHFKPTPDDVKQKEEGKRISHVFICAGSTRTAAVQSAVKYLSHAFQRFNDVQVDVSAAEKRKKARNASEAYTIYVGMTPPAISKPLNFGEGGYVTESETAFIFWDKRFIETVTNTVLADRDDVPIHPAVATFLTRECGIYRVDPSPEGLFTTKARFTLPSEKSVRHVSPGARGLYRGTANNWTQKEEEKIPQNLLPESAKRFRYYAGLNQFNMLSFYQLLPVSSEPDRDIDCTLPPNTGIPFGAGKTFSETFTPSSAEKIYIEGGAIDTYTTFSHYVILRKALNPQINYDSLTTEYVQYYGTASQDIRKYLRHWENVFHSPQTEGDLYLKALTPERRSSWLTWFYDNLCKFTEPDDFKKARKILDTAASRDLNRLQKKRLDRLMLHFEHARLTYNTVRLINQPDPDRETMEAAIEKAQALPRFRRRFTGLLQTDPIRLSGREISSNDVSGIRFSRKTSKLQPLRKLSPRWFFKRGSRQKGVAQKWFAISHGKLEQWQEHKIKPTPWKGKAFPEVLNNERFPSEVWIAKALNLGKRVRNKGDIYVAFRGVSGKCSFYWDGDLLQNIHAESEKNCRTVLFKIDEADVRAESPHTLIVNWQSQDSFKPPWRDAWIMAGQSEN